jgi:spore germination protein Q
MNNYCIPQSGGNYMINSNIPIYTNESAMKNKPDKNIKEETSGKKITLYTSFFNSSEWSNKIFKGILEYSTITHLIISDPKSGKWYAIAKTNINYIEFDEEITKDSFLLL